MIALVDYKAGNLTSVRKALAAIGADVYTPDTPAALAPARGIIVPGVGHFDATRVLEGAWRDAIAAEIAGGKPLCGICLGMQWLFEGSDEAPDIAGLGVLPGRITRLRGDAAHRVKVPHVGWNALDFRSDARLLEGLSSGVQVYFTHSYAAPITDACVASTTHLDPFTSVVERGNVFGTQFHPEKSSDAGLQMLRNFLRACQR